MLLTHHRASLLILHLDVINERLKKIKINSVLRSNFIIEFSPHRVKWGMLQVDCMLSSGHTEEYPHVSCLCHTLVLVSLLVWGQGIHWGHNVIKLWGRVGSSCIRICIWM